MKKKKSGGGGANWMDTYGDMVTLLLCFFVLLYSMSTIDSDKWKAIVMSFNPLASHTPTENPEGVNGGNLHDPDIDQDASGIMQMPTGELSQEQQEVVDAMAAMLQALEVVSEEQGQNLNVAVSNGRIFVTFNQTAFFDGDSFALRKDSLPILDQVAAILDEHRNYLDMVEVIGHTAQASPDKPNQVESDRRISAQRATSVVIYIQEHTKIDPARLVDMGRGQWVPIGDNKDEAGRAPNRRVEMIISGRDLEDVLGGYILSYDSYDT